MIERNKKIVMILSVLLTIVLGISLSYAYFYYGQEGQDIILQSGNVALNFAEGSNYLNISNAYPKSDTMGMIDSNYYDFTITGSKEDENIYYEIQIVEEEGNTISSKYVKVYLTDQNDNKIIKPTLLKDLPYSEHNDNRVIDNYYIYKDNQLYDYRLRVWIDESYTENVVNTFNFKIEIYAYNKEGMNLNAVRFIKSKLGTDGLVAINTSGELASSGDTIREYRYSGNARYCTYTNSGTTYTLNVESYESTCPKACINTNEWSQTYIIHRTSDEISLGYTRCSTELTPNETVPTEGTVKNYIKYNNELWRIIGVFNETMRKEITGIENSQELIKIIKDTPISKKNLSGSTYTYNGTTMTLSYTGFASPYSYFYWNYSKYFGQTNYDDWTKAALQYYLNDESSANSYYNSIEASERVRIATVKYYLGNVPNSNNMANTAYTEERETNIWDGNSTYWYGKIGLMYPSDYGYAAASENWTTAMVNYSELTNTGSQQNWLRDEAKMYEWFISPSADYSFSAMVVRHDGYVHSLGINDNRSNGVVSPVLYLKSETTIIGGTGAYNDPYTLG